MDFFPLESDVGDVQAACWEAQDEIARRIDSLLSSLAEPLARADAETETAIVRLVRRMQSAVRRGCKPLDDAIAALIDGLVRPVNDAINLIDQQIIAVQQGVRGGQLPGANPPPGRWWFDDSDSGTINIQFVPHLSRPPPPPGRWKGPYDKKEGAERGWMERHGRGHIAPHGVPPHHATPGGPISVIPLPPRTPAPSPSPFPAPAVPPPGSPPPRPPNAPPPPPPPPQFPRGVQPGPLPGTPVGGYVTLPGGGGEPTPTQGGDGGGSTTTVIEDIENVGGSESSARADVTVINEPAPLQQATSVRVPPCGIQPGSLSEIVGVVLIPPQWYPDEESDAESECGQAMIESSRARWLPASEIAAAYATADPYDAVGYPVPDEPLPDLLRGL